MKQSRSRGSGEERDVEKEAERDSAEDVRDDEGKATVALNDTLNEGRDRAEDKVEQRLPRTGQDSARRSTDKLHEQTTRRRLCDALLVA